MTYYMWLYGWRELDGFKGTFSRTGRLHFAVSKQLKFRQTEAVKDMFISDFNTLVGE